ncbi:zinc-dependent alcohol dehydrogenase [Brevibacillus sp. NRS-1366]|uniref:zinc-dependent alcohol dehydrogenase n=1 Tax=Brevibacillus sp. NRS-1366 TaxID=3233899 RepID=UPI003D25E1D9
MKALVKASPGLGNVEVREVPEPVCQPDGVKIEVAYTGICGTDLHIYHDTFKNYPPVIMGHEFSGVVAEVGAEVTSCQVGDRVTILPSTAITCGTCSYCRVGHYMFCPDRRGMGHGVNGSFTRFVHVREDMVYKIPAEVSLEEAALSEPLACAVQAIEELTTIRVGDTVLLSGPGPIGLMCLSLLVMKGCKVIVAGTDADVLRLDLARKLGADLVVNVSVEDLEAILHKQTGGSGVDVAVECAGVGLSISSCLKALKKRGTYIQVGIVGKEITLDFDTILYKQLAVFGSLAHSMQTWDRVMNILKQGKINLSSIITDIMPLHKWEEAFQKCERKTAGKVLIHYGE